jgi:hypothetical protein
MKVVKKKTIALMLFATVFAMFIAGYLIREQKVELGISDFIALGITFTLGLIIIVFITKTMNKK